MGKKAYSGNRTRGERGGYCWSFHNCNHSIKYEQTASVELKLPTKKPAPKKFYSPLTGMEIANEAAAKLPVTGVMIENSPAARPQSGLKKAGVVYEAVAEGGITRFWLCTRERNRR